MAQSTKEHVYGTDPTKEEKIIIGTFRTLLEESEEYKAHPKECSAYLTEYNCHRFLAARDYNVKKALKLMKSHLNWRFTVYKPYSILPVDVEEYARRGAVQSIPHGLDKHGRPILVLDDSKENCKISNAKEKQRAAMTHLVFHMERCISKYNDKVRRYVLFINLTDFRLLSAPNLSTSRETINIFGSQYPETLGLAVLYKAPWAFTQFWNAIKYFIDPKTRNKIVFISGNCKDGSKNDKKLRALIGDNWKSLTGVGLPKPAPDIANGYDHKAYWSMVETEFRQGHS